MRANTLASLPWVLPPSVLTTTMGQFEGAWAPEVATHCVLDNGNAPLPASAFPVDEAHAYLRLQSAVGGMHTRMLCVGGCGWVWVLGRGRGARVAWGSLSTASLCAGGLQYGRQQYCAVARGHWPSGSGMVRRLPPRSGSVGPDVEDAPFTPGVRGQREPGGGGGPGEQEADAARGSRGSRHNPDAVSRWRGSGHGGAQVASRSLCRSAHLEAQGRELLAYPVAPRLGH